jgi:DNA-binding transcriptional ArsR family regulator
MRTLFHPAREELLLPQVLWALSDPLRLQILRELDTTNEAPCSAFYQGMAKSTLSHHLRVLREAGITRTRSAGTSLFISLRREDLEARFPGLLDAILRAYQISGEEKAQEAAPT